MDITKHFVLGVLLVVLAAGLTACTSKLENQVKKGVIELWCHFEDGYRQVEPSKVMYQLDNTWVFTNGYSSSCNLQR